MISRPASRASAQRTAGLILAALLLATACTDKGTSAKGIQRKGPAETTAAPQASAIAWGSCEDAGLTADAEAIAAAEESEGLQCSTFEVPLDHAKPTGPKIKLALTLFPSTGDEKSKIGTIFSNPGGPGESGNSFVINSISTFPPELREQFDFVGFDPRGVGASTPLNCLTSDEREEMINTPSPAELQAKIDAAVAQEKAIAEACAKNAPELSKLIGTDQVVDDLDALRSAVGDEQLSYLGYSYGTRIGAAYATKYPDRVRAILLDSTVGPDDSEPVPTGATQEMAISRALQREAADCDADTTCPLAASSLDQMATVYRNLFTTPVSLTTPKGEDPFTHEEFAIGILTALYQPSQVPVMLEAVAAMVSGEPDKVQKGAAFIASLAALQTGAEPDGTYGNSFEQIRAINCLDQSGPTTVSDLAQAKELRGEVPFVLASVLEPMPSCSSMPTGKGFTFTKTEAAEHILVIGSKGDPATPYEDSQALAETLGATFITYEGDGHAPSSQITCLSEQVTAFMLATTAENPQDCPVDPTESDFYAALTAGITGGMATPTQATCITETLKSTVSLLDLASLVSSEDPDLGAMETIGSAVEDCIIGEAEPSETTEDSPTTKDG